MSDCYRRGGDGATDRFGRALRGTRADRSRSRSPQRHYKSGHDAPRQNYNEIREFRNRGNGSGGGQGNANSQSEEKKSLDWIKQEDIFALRQKRRGSVIRVKEDRSQFLDHLLVNLLLAEYEVTRSSTLRANLGLAKPDPQDVIALNELFGEIDHIDDEIKSVDTIVYSDFVTVPELEDLIKGIMDQIDLEKKAQKTSHYKPILAREYWISNLDIIKHRIKEINRQQNTSKPEGPNLFSQDIHNILKDKSYQDLINLETRVKQNIETQSNKDFWENLHEQLILKKSRMKLKELDGYANAAKHHFLKLLQNNEAIRAQINLKNYMAKKGNISTDAILYSPDMDVPQLNYPTDGLTYRTLNEWVQDLYKQRTIVKESGFIIKSSKFRQNNTPHQQNQFPHHNNRLLPQAKTTTGEFIRKVGSSVPFPKEIKEDRDDNSSLELFKREESRRVNEDEQLLTEDNNNNAYNPNMIKPRYHNRVILGYDWNAYNKAHYDSENKPPKMVQGYRFNLYYPDLPSGMAPTYKIIRDSHSQDTSGETLEKTCIIKFSAGFPYQDISFRIIDKAWDQGSHRGSMYRSKFDRGLLQLHFKFKKTVYRR